MGQIVNLKVAAERREVDIEAAWERFRAAAARSKETLDLRDGIAAGKAYAEFLELCARSGR